MHCIFEHFQRSITTVIWPSNSPDLNPVDYHIWSVLEQRVYRTRIRDVNHLKSWHVWLKSGRCLITVSSSNGVHVCGYVFENKEDTLNISCSAAWICFTDCHWLKTNGALFETLYFECCISNVHKTGNVLYASIKKLPILDDLLCCL